ncbi:MAG: hypothetical protein LWX07_08550 [Bacteroidetes bacterium]|nr:hypothetical protein [Bacteroidota bacterium]
MIEEMTVNRILFVGNNVTRDEVILREMKTKEGQKLNLKDLDEDVRRIYNLGLFNRIDVVPAPLSGNMINLVFEFEEMFYFLPVPQGGIKEGSFKKLWGGLNFMWRNFRGKNETINLSFGLGYEPFIALGFSNPWIFKNQHYFYNFGVSYSRTYPRSTGLSDSVGRFFKKDDIPTYTLNNFQSSLRFGKYLGDNMSLSGILAYNSYSTSEYEKGRTINTDGIDRYFTVAADLTYDTRDYAKFATYGSYYNLQVSRIGLFSSSFDLNKFRTDLRRYIPLKLSNDYALVLVARYSSVITFGGGSLPVYLSESFGYADLIRGWDNYVFEGEDKMMGSLEMRIPILKPFYVKGKDHFILRKIPVMKQLSYRYGLYATVFIDAGGVWGRSERLFNTQFRNGYGIGLNFLLPFDFVYRTDFAVRHENNRYKGQIIFSLDSSF